MIKCIFVCISVGALVVMGHICFDSRFVNLNTFVYKDELLTVVDILFLISAGA